MGDSLRVACVQMNAGPDKSLNIRKADRLVSEAASKGAELIVLPEKWDGLGGREVLDASAENLVGGQSATTMSAWARRFKVHIVGGSITERRPGRERFSNSCVAIGPDGTTLGVYRKIHMYDVEIQGQMYRESALEEPGDEAVIASMRGWQVGLAICYDLRFPELFRTLALGGAQLTVLPAAFNSLTGPEHWETLLRARAIENQCFVAAAGQWGPREDGKEMFGHSMIIDPWGRVLSSLDQGDSVCLADIDLRTVLDVRAALPSLANRQPASYRLRQQPSEGV